MTVWLGPARPTRCHMAALSRSFRRLRDDYPGGRGGDVVRKKTGWVIGLFAALAISILLVGSLGYSLVFQEEPAPLGTNRAARPTAPSSTAAAPSAPQAAQPPKSPPAVAASLIPPPPSVVTPSGPQAAPPATPPAPAAAAPLAIQRLAGPTVPPAPTTAAPSAASSIPPPPSTAVTPSRPQAAPPPAPAAAAPSAAQPSARPAAPAAPTAAAPAAALPTAMPAEAAMSAADRRQVQAALLRLGYDPGPEDGLFGPLTRAAIRRFQQSVGAEPTGIITADQASRLVSMPTPTTSQ